MKRAIVLLLALAAACSGDPSRLDAPADQRVGIGFAVPGGGFVSPTRIISSSGSSGSTAALTVGVISPTAITGTVNDWSPAGLATATVIMVSTTANVTLNGIDSTGATEGRELCLVNTSAHYVLINNQNTGSLAANRFTNPNTNGWYLEAIRDEPACYVYTVANQWQMLTPGSNVPALFIDNNAASINNSGQASLVSVTASNVTASTTPNSSFNSAFTPSGRTLDYAGVYLPTAGTFNTTSSTLTNTGLYASLTSTRSTGTNNLTNRSGYFNASGAQVNQAIYTDAGDNVFNATSGSSEFRGHMRATGTSPAISGCGTGSAITGSDTAFRITGGSSGVACTITFHTAYTTTAPICVVFPEGSTTLPNCSISTTALTCGSSIANTVKYDWHCWAPN